MYQVLLMLYVIQVIQPSWRTVIISKNLINSILQKNYQSRPGGKTLLTQFLSKAPLCDTLKHCRQFFGTWHSNRIGCGGGSGYVKKVLYWRIQIRNKFIPYPQHCLSKSCAYSFSAFWKPTWQCYLESDLVDSTSEVLLLCSSNAVLCSSPDLTTTSR